MKNNILISVILALVVALGVVVIGSDEAVAQTNPSNREYLEHSVTGISDAGSFCMEGYVFIQGATLIQVFEARIGNNSVPMKCE